MLSRRVVRWTSRVSRRRSRRASAALTADVDTPRPRAAALSEPASTTCRKTRIPRRLLARPLLSFAGVSASPRPTCRAEPGLSGDVFVAVFIDHHAVGRALTWSDSIALLEDVSRHEAQGATFVSPKFSSDFRHGSIRILFAADYVSGYAATKAYHTLEN